MVVFIALGLALVGCGESRVEREANEQKRLELEQQAAKEIQQSNEAVNEVSRKLGREAPTMDLGLPADQPEKAPADAPKAAESDAGAQSAPATPAEPVNP